jgi:hypothetical protein
MSPAVPSPRPAPCAPSAAAVRPVRPDRPVVRARLCRLAATALAIALCACGTLGSSSAPDGSMGFFVTSVGMGRGGDLGGLAGADAHCQKLAASVGEGSREWRAYLSTRAARGVPGVDARSRIGTGPWLNARGDVIAATVAELHGDNNLRKATALDQRGQVVNGRDDVPNRHDILTGSRSDGVVMPGEVDTTCRNWTSSTDGAAMVGHHDRLGSNDSASARSWNSSHLTQGCSPAALAATGGAGLLYCFAAR